MAVEAQHPSSMFFIGSPLPSQMPDPVPTRKRLRDDVDLEAIVAQQRDELSQMLRSHSDQMRRLLTERRRTQMVALMGIASESLSCKLREKESEIERVRRYNVELEGRAAQLRGEVQLWQGRARAQEASAVALQAQLQQAVAALGTDDGAVDAQAEDQGSAFVDPDRATSSAARTMAPFCRACHVAVARVVVLPCRHLCLCSDCGVTAETCPVCFHLRNSSVEVFFS